MSDLFFVTPVSELEQLADWTFPLAFQAAHHHESFDASEKMEVEWKPRDRVEIKSSFSKYGFFIQEFVFCRVI